MLQSSQDALYFAGFEVASHSVFDLDLLLFLIQFPADYLEVDRINDQIF